MGPIFQKYTHFSLLWYRSTQWAMHHPPPPPTNYSTLQKKNVFKMHMFVLFLMYSISPMVLPLRSLISIQLKRILLAFTHAHVYVYQHMHIYRVIKKSLCTWPLQYNHQVHRDFLITLYIQSVPGVKFTTSGFNSRADLSQKCHIHMGQIHNGSGVMSF